MTRVLVPVRYPPSEHSKRTLRRAMDIAKERDAELTVLHVDVYQEPGHVTRTQLKRAVERAVGRVPRARYVVRQGFLVEETILDEVAAEEADVVVIGHKQIPGWQRAVKHILGEPDVESLLREQLNCELVRVPPP